MEKNFFKYINSGFLKVRACRSVKFFGYIYFSNSVIYVYILDGEKTAVVYQYQFII